MPVPSFAPPDVAFIRPFWDGVAAGELRLPQCGACGRFQWYPIPGTPHCPSAPLTWTTVPPTGTVFSFTVVRRPFLPGATRADVPVTSVLVDLDGAPGMRLVGMLGDGGPAPRIGMRVEASFPEVHGRRTVQFVPVDHDEGEPSGAPTT
jgi:uncharacterized protein